MRAARVGATLAAALALSAYLGAVGPATRSTRSTTPSSPPIRSLPAAASQPPPPAVFPLRLPPESAPLGTQLWTNGQPLALRWFESPAGPAAEAERWARALKAEHGAVARRRVPRGWHLAARDARGGVVSVLVLGRPHGGSLVVPAASRGPVRPGAEAGRLGLPLFPGRRAVTSHAALDGGVERVTVQHLAPRPAGEVAAWYRARLAEQGFRAAPPTGGPPGTFAAYARAEAHVWLAVQATEQGTFVVLVREGRP